MRVALSHTLINSPLKQVASLSYFRGELIRLLEKKGIVKKDIRLGEAFFNYSFFSVRAIFIQKNSKTEFTGGFFD